eukprot:14824795-Alexandrium_andersonii.AAC.1
MSSSRRPPPPLPRWPPSGGPCGGGPPPQRGEMLPAPAAGPDRPWYRGGRPAFPCRPPAIETCFAHFRSR